MRFIECKVRHACGCMCVVGKTKTSGLKPSKQWSVAGKQQSNQSRSQILMTGWRTATFHCCDGFKPDVFVLPTTHIQPQACLTLHSINLTTWPFSVMEINGLLVGEDHFLQMVHVCAVHKTARIQQ